MGEIHKALLGKARYLEITHQYKQAIDIYNQIIVMYPIFMPALTEKAKSLIKLGDWDQANETLHSVLAQDDWNIEARTYSALFVLVRDFREDAAINLVEELYRAIEKFEPKNPKLYNRIASVFSRLSGKNKKFAFPCSPFPPQQNTPLADS